MKNTATESTKKILCKLSVYLLMALSFVAVNYFTLFFSRMGTEHLKFYYIFPHLFTDTYILIMFGIYFIFPKAVSITIYGIINLVFMVFSLSQVLFLRIFGRVYGISDLLYAQEGGAFFGALKEYFSASLIIGLLGLLLLLLLTLYVMIRVKKEKSSMLHKGLCIVFVLFVCLSVRYAITDRKSTRLNSSH